MLSSSVGSLWILNDLMSSDTDKRIISVMAMCIFIKTRVEATEQMTL